MCFYSTYSVYSIWIALIVYFYTDSLESSNNTHTYLHRMQTYGRQAYEDYSGVVCMACANLYAFY